MLTMALSLKTDLQWTWLMPFVQNQVTFEQGAWTLGIRPHLHLENGCRPARCVPELVRSQDIQGNTVPQHQLNWLCATQCWDKSRYIVIINKKQKSNKCFNRQVRGQNSYVFQWKYFWSHAKLFLLHNLQFFVWCWIYERIAIKLEVVQPCLITPVKLILCMQ